MNGQREHAVVIGGSSGVGLATAAELASHAGLDVTIVGRDETRLARAGETLPEHVRRSRADASDRGALDALFEQLSPIHHLVLAASGGAGAGPFAELDLNDLRSGLEAKLLVQLGAAQAALPALTPGGSMTFVTAISARMAQPGTGGLAAINGALEAIVPTLAVELAPIRVNAVSPGVIDTPWWDFLDAGARRSTFDAYAAKTPVGRVGQPVDVARVIVAVALNSFITGAIVPCDGGLRLTP